MDKVKEILLPANRQYRHNSENGLLQGYDVYETRKIVAALLAEIEELKARAEDAERQRDEWQGMYRVAAERADKFELRIAQLEEALRGVFELPTAIRSIEYINKGIGTATKEGKIWLAARQALTSTPSALAEVLRAARHAEDLHSRGLSANLCSVSFPCPLCKAVRKYEEENKC